MTYDPGTDSVTMGDNLTPDEQESLKVGEELQAQQEGLLAGKYKTAEELERAYGELERKLGEQGNKDSSTTDETEVSESNKVSKETKEASEDSKEYYLADGKVNYDQVNSQYGEQLGNIFKDSEIDPWSMNNYFHENNGSLSDDMYDRIKLTGWNFMSHVPSHRNFLQIS